MKAYILLLLCGTICITSCVSKKKFLKEIARVKDLRVDSAGTHNKLNDCYSTVAALQKEKESVQKDLQALSSSSKDSIAKSQMTIAEQAKRLKDLQDLIQGQKDVMNKLKKTIADALVNFKPDELTVSIKDGKIYVSLQENLLFKSGSDIVDPKGKEALKSVADVLNKSTDISILIEGHTDSIPIRGRFADNWALSTARATSIVRILTDAYSVDAHRVTAAGRGEYYPITSNSTPEGRSKNRRTEIILAPNLNELFKLLDQ
ncbi:MAG: flagellar motor protein MotB [Bacteroidetes bacterium]|jgi:chemotaxis protein MotB|nr:flagellar motor protein MotB [Bacteroidota bacterium]MDF2450927.1 flagellar motor protein MotB [Bacteroidota bacterium]